MRTRLVTATALLAGLGALALPSSAATPAAPAPQLTDPSGDSYAPMGGMDIVSGLWATTGTTKKVGKKTVYTPKSLTITVGYADAVTANPGAGHEVRFTAPCGDVYLEFSAALMSETYTVCGPNADDVAGTAVVDGKNLVFTVDLASLGAKAGSALTNLRALTTGAEPVVGQTVTDFSDSSAPWGTAPEAFASDNATSTATYTVK